MTQFKNPTKAVEDIIVLLSKVRAIEGRLKMLLIVAGKQRGPVKRRYKLEENK